MKRQWKKIWVKATFWLATEIILNLLGLDNLADYSEFIFEQEIAISKRQPQIAIVVPFRCPNVNRNLLYPFIIKMGLKPRASSTALHCTVQWLWSLTHPRRWRHKP